MGETSTANRPSVLLLDPRDTVAVAIAPLSPGTAVPVRRGTGVVRIVAETLIPFGHKIAVAPMDAGEPVLKYGEVIGFATSPIRPGQHVHVHNVKSDWARTGNG